MSKTWSEKQNGALQGKWFTFKSMGYTLLLINASQDEKLINLEYILEREGHIETVKASVPFGSMLSSVTEVFPQGAQMQQEIAQRFPITFSINKPECNNTGNAMTEWGPFHPLLPEPVKFKLWMKDEVIESTVIETGYNYRGLEGLCVGKKPEDVLDMLERISVVNGFCCSFSYVHAIENIHGTEIPERAQWLRMLLMEMSFLYAGLQSLNLTARSLGLLALSARIFKLALLYHEASALISVRPKFSGILEIGGLSSDISREKLYAINAILQELETELKDIRNQWERTPSIAKRLKAAGKIDEAQARFMTGRLTRAAGFPEDLRKQSVLPWSKLSYTIPKNSGSNCFARAMLMLDDTLLSLDLIDQIIENLPKGSVKALCRADGSGEALVREPEAYGGMAVLVRQKEGRLQSIKIRNAATLNISFLPDCLRGMEIIDLPLVLSTIELDLSAMEK